jgi:hypothetical protein
MARANLGPIRALLSNTRERFIEAADEFPAEKWAEPPTLGSWSAAEIVTHTMQVEEAIILASRKVLSRAPHPVPFLKRFHLPLVLATARGRKLESPIPIDPARVPAKVDYQAKIAEVREATLAFMSDTAERDLSSYNFPHDVFGPLNLYGWFRLIAYHELRHAKQIREVAEIFHG